MNTIYSYTACDIDGKQVSFSQFKGKVLLIVNTASKCGFTRQYTELEKLYQKYNDTGFEIIAFPCDQFLNQEPGSNDEIKSFCSLNYNVTFKIFSKIEVNGINEHPLYNYLKSNKPGLFGSRAIKWNFTKFLVSKNGEVVKRYAPITNPIKLENKINQLLAE